MRKRGSGQRNKGAEVEFWGVEGREMGFIGLVTRPKLGETGEKDNPFCNFFGHGKRHHNQVENKGKTHSKPSISPLYRILIINTMQLSFTPLPQ